MAKLVANNEAHVSKTNTRTGAEKLKPDLTEVEASFLRALLIDPVDSNDESERKDAKVLNDDILFSLPFVQEKEPVPEKKGKGRRRSLLLGLWKAHEEGVKPRVLVRKASSHAALKQEEAEEEGGEDDVDAVSIKSDEEVRGDAHDDTSSCSTWGEEEGDPEHYDAWEVLKDEYAQDFGFDYEPSTFEEDVEDQGHVFKILGTSTDDVAAHPHVLSPPLMDSLMTFMPDSLQNQNFWLKYSLVRDGASMQTLKQYVRASHNNVLAIETTTGEVFGAFTTSPWRTQFGFFGEGDGCFLWRMRYNRNTPCHSLFEQAQMESEIDVFAYSGLNNLIQHCSHQKIAIGGGNIHDALSESDDEIELPADVVRGETDGFGIAIGQDLDRGTTSPCATFCNPSLVSSSSGSQTFDIANMEVWTLTPAWDVKGAEKMEMTKYFVDQSTHSADSSIHSTYSDYAAYSPSTRNGSAQEQFYRRVGENDDYEERRIRWQYANMMGQF